MSGAGLPAKGYVEVVFNYETTNDKGHSVNVHKGERYALLDSLDDEWWAVCKPTDFQERFYLPRSYVRPLDTAEVEQMSTFRTNVRASGLYEMAKTNYVTKPAEGAESAAALRVAGTKRTSGDDPHVKRLSKSIPVSLNFAHDILLDIPIADGSGGCENPSTSEADKKDSTIDCHNDTAESQLDELDKPKGRSQLDSYEEEPSDLGNSQVSSTSEDENNLASSDEEIDENYAASEASHSGMVDSTFVLRDEPERVSRHRSYHSAIQASEHIYANTEDLHKPLGENLNVRSSKDIYIYIYIYLPCMLNLTKNSAFHH